MASLGCSPVAARHAHATLSASATQRCPHGLCQCCRPVALGRQMASTAILSPLSSSIAVVASRRGVWSRTQQLKPHATQRESTGSEQQLQASSKVAGAMAAAVLTAALTWQQPAEAAQQGSSGNGGTHQLAVDRAWLEGLLVQEMRSRVETLPDDQLLGVFERMLRDKQGDTGALSALPPAPRLSDSPPEESQPQPQPQPQRQQSWSPWGAARQSSAPGSPAVEADAAERRRQDNQAIEPQLRSQAGSGRAGPAAAAAESPAEPAAPTLQQRLLGGLPRGFPGRQGPQESRQTGTSGAAAAGQAGTGREPAQQVQGGRGGADASAAAAVPSNASWRIQQETEQSGASQLGAVAGSQPAERTGDEQALEDRTAELLRASGVLMPGPDAADRTASSQQQQPGQQSGGARDTAASGLSRISNGIAGAGSWVALLAQQGRLPGVLAAAAAVVGLQFAVPAAIRWQYPRLAAEGQPAPPLPPQNTGAASASAVPAGSSETASDASGVVWRRPAEAEAAAGQPLPAGGGGLAEAGFPGAGGVFPSMPSPWDDPEFYTLGLHMGPPPPPPLLGPAAAAAAAAAGAAVMPDVAEPVQQGGVLWQRDAQSPEQAVENGEVLWRRETDSPEPSVPHQGGANPPAAAAGDTSLSNGSDSGTGGLADGSATSLPPRPMRMPIIPSRRMRSGRGGVPAAGSLQDDPAVLDNLEDSGTSHRRPLAAAAKSGGTAQ